MIPTDTTIIMTLNELASLIGAPPHPDRGDLPVTGVSSLAEAREGDVSFYGNPRYLSQLRTTRASAVIVAEDFSEGVPPILLRCGNPSSAFAAAVAAFAPAEIIPAPGVHPTAFVDGSVLLGEGVSIGPKAVIEAGVRIGKGTVIGAGCLIGEGTVIGADCRF